MKIQSFERIAFGIQSIPSGINAHTKHAVALRLENLHMGITEKIHKKTFTPTNENIQWTCKKLS